MLVYAYSHGAPIAGLVAVAQLVRRPSWRPWRRPSRTGARPWFCWPGDLAQAAVMAATAAAVIADAPTAAYAAAVVAATAVTTTRPAHRR